MSIFYRVLHTQLADIKSGAENRRRGERDDTRDKSALFPVKQLEQSRRWLIPGVGDGQAQQEVQVGPEQVPIGRHHHGRQPRRARSGTSGQQQGHPGLQLAGHGRRRKGPGIRTWQVKLPRHRRDAGRGGRLGEGTEHV